VRRARFDLDEQALRPYFALDRVREGAFRVANRLYGITFTELTGVPVYHPEAKALEVKDADGSHLAVFYADYHPRPGKRGGAWSSRYRGTWVENGVSIRPVVANVGNFSRPAGDAPALLSIEEAETLFHELGHGLPLPQPLLPAHLRGRVLVGLLQLHLGRGARRRRLPGLRGEGPLRPGHGTATRPFRIEAGETIALTPHMGWNGWYVFNRGEGAVGVGATEGAAIG
jgi:hypothetical protein